MDPSPQSVITDGCVVNDSSVMDKLPITWATPTVQKLVHEA